MDSQAQYAVVFVSQRNGNDPQGYDAMAEKMETLARNQPGFVGIDSVRGADGKGLTVSYWSDLPAIHQWRTHAEHLVAQRQGRQLWYESYQVFVTKIERQWEFCAPTLSR